MSVMSGQHGFPQCGRKTSCNVTVFLCNLPACLCNVCRDIEDEQWCLAAECCLLSLSMTPLSGPNVVKTEPHCVHIEILLHMFFKSHARFVPPNIIRFCYRFAMALKKKVFCSFRVWQKIEKKNTACLGSRHFLPGSAFFMGKMSLHLFVT